MKKLIPTVLLATGAGALTFAAAASMPVSSQNLGSGGTTVVSCDTDGVEVSYDLVPQAHQLVGGITVDGIDPACVGQTLHWALSDSASAYLADGETEVTGTTQSFSLSSDVESEVIGEVAVTIAG
ncbi:MAG: hypothetical protein WBA72_07700 [Ornithinimicrobium sp.]